MTGVGAGALRADWGVGQYERTAAQLAPTSVVVVERAAPQASERVLDLGCGTGNAALLAAGRGAPVTGVDPAPRLLDVARARAADEGADVTFALGEATAIPMESGSVDVLLSVFGVTFAPDRSQRPPSWRESPLRALGSYSARGCPKVPLARPRVWRARR